MRMEPMTRQDMFNKAYIGLKDQNFEKAWDGASKGCMYRDKRGRKCAIGFLIPDFAYNHWFEGKRVEQIYEVLGFQDRDANFLNELQHCHDGAGDPADMRNRLRHFAMMNRLTVPEDHTNPCGYPYHNERRQVPAYNGLMEAYVYRTINVPKYHKVFEVI